MRQWIAVCSLLLMTSFVQAAPTGVFRADAKVPMAKVYPAVYQAVEQARFWVVFEADLGANLARFSQAWGDDYNRSQLDGIRSMVVCNGWQANAVANLDPDLLALCPLRINFVEKDGTTRVLFARPSVIATGSPAAAKVLDIENLIISAIRAGITQAEEP